MLTVSAVDIIVLLLQHNVIAEHNVTAEREVYRAYPAYRSIPECNIIVALLCRADRTGQTSFDHLSRIMLRVNYDTIIGTEYHMIYNYAASLKHRPHYYVLYPTLKTLLCRPHRFPLVGLSN